MTHEKRTVNGTMKTRATHLINNSKHSFTQTGKVIKQNEGMTIIQKKVTEPIKQLKLNL